MTPQSAHALAALLDPAWALPANTLLLVILAIVQHRSNRKLYVAAEDAKRAAGASRRAPDPTTDTGERRRWTDSPSPSTTTDRWIGG